MGGYVRAGGQGGARRDEATAAGRRMWGHCGSGSGAGRAAQAAPSFHTPTAHSPLALHAQQLLLGGGGGGAQVLPGKLAGQGAPHLRGWGRRVSLHCAGGGQRCPAMPGAAPSGTGWGVRSSAAGAPRPPVSPRRCAHPPTHLCALHVGDVAGRASGRASWPHTAWGLHTGVSRAQPSAELKRRLQQRAWMGHPCAPPTLQGAPLQAPPGSSACSPGSGSPGKYQQRCQQRTYEEIEVPDQRVLAHQRGGQPQLAVRLDDAQHAAEHGRRHHVHLAVGGAGEAGGGAGGRRKGAWQHTAVPRTQRTHTRHPQHSTAQHSTHGTACTSSSRMSPHSRDRMCCMIRSPSALRRPLNATCAVGG